MIEDELRRAFERHEDLVSDAARLRPAIDARVRRVRVRRRVSGSTALVLAVLAAVMLPALARDQLRPAPVGSPTTTPVVGGALNYLVLGLDQGESGGHGRRADTIIVAHVPADRSAVYLITIPRDVFVAGSERISGAYAPRGFAGVADAVTGLTGLTFDGGATLELAGLARLTDAVGGVDLCVDQETRSIHYDRNGVYHPQLVPFDQRRVYPVGCRHFSGAEATDYLRQRQYDTGALERDRHQVDYLLAVLSKLDVRSLLTSPSKLSGVLDAAGSALVVDLRGRQLSDVLADIRPALGHVVGIGTPVVPAQVGLSYGWRLAPDAAGLFAAARSDTLAAWLARHPGVVTHQ